MTIGEILLSFFSSVKVNVLYPETIGLGSYGGRSVVLMPTALPQQR